MSRQEKIDKIITMSLILIIIAILLFLFIPFISQLIARISDSNFLMLYSLLTYLSPVLLLFWAGYALYIWKK